MSRCASTRVRTHALKVLHSTQRTDDMPEGAEGSLIDHVRYSKRISVRSRLSYAPRGSALREGRKEKRAHIVRFLIKTLQVSVRRMLCAGNHCHAGFRKGAP